MTARLTPVHTHNLDGKNPYWLYSGLGIPIIWPISSKGVKRYTMQEMRKNSQELFTIGIIFQRHWQDKSCYLPEQRHEDEVER